MTLVTDGSTHSDFAAQGKELRREYLALLLGVAAVLWACAVMRAAAWRDAPGLFHSWSVALTLGVGLVVTSALRTRDERLAGWVFLLSLIAATVVEVVHFPHGPSFYLFALVGVMAAVLRSERGAAVIYIVILGAMGVTAWALRSEISLNEFFAPALITALISFVSWLGTRQLYTVLQWEWHSTQQALAAAREAQDHRAELARLNKELDGAYQRLERMNHMLVLARKEAEDATALKVQFANAVSHELRSPINMIVGFSDMMVNSPEVYGRKSWPPRLKNHIIQIYQSSQHLSQLIDDVLDMARIDAYRLTLVKERTQLVDVIEEATEIVRSLFEARGLYLRVEMPDDLPPVALDRTRIRQVLLNLLTNAARFTSEGGVTVRILQQASEVVIRVTDTGAGIAAEDLPKLFQVFCQLEGSYRWGRGSGLGLAISKQLIDLHGGRIWAESELGKGATFFFALPLERELETSLSTHGPSDDAFWSRLEQEARDHRPIIAWDVEPAAHRLLTTHLHSYDITWMPHRSDLASETDDSEARLIQATTDSQPFAVVRVSGQCDTPLLPSANVVDKLPDVAFVTCVLPGLARKPAHADLNDYLIKPVSRRRLAEALARVAERCGRIRRLVIVEDEAPMREFLTLSVTTILGGKCAVFEAGCGQDALDLVGQHHPDLVLLDLNLPDMDGLALAMQIRSQFGDVTMIAITARDYELEDCHTEPDVICCARMKRFSQHEIDGVLNAVLGSLNHSTSANTNVSLSDGKAIPSAVEQIAAEVSAS